MMIQVELIRGRIFRLVKDLSIYISCLPEREEDALIKFTEANRQETYAKIAGSILKELGHESELPPEERGSRTRRSAAKV